jgi:hypothetical protein
MWFDEYTGSGRGQGFLGQPLAPGARIADTPATPDLLSGDGAFDTASQTAKWEFDVEAPALASAARESTTTHAGAGALRVSVTNATGTDWHVAETHAAPMKAGSDDTLSFWARADHPRTLHAWTQQTHDPYNDWADFGSAAITTSWQHFVLTGNSGGTDVSAQLQLGFGETTGTIYLDDVRLQSGSPEVWRRRFTGGAAIVNATAAPAKASLGGLYRLLKGTQAPGVNSGHLAYVVTLPARDGLVVASVDAAQLASQMASASAAWTGAAATASGAASHFGALAKRGSARSRASAKRARAAWLAVAKQARPAATACGAARDALASSRVKAPGLVQSAATASAAAVAGAKVSLKLRAASQASAAATQARAADALVRGVYSSAR